MVALVAMLLAQTLVGTPKGPVYSGPERRGISYAAFELAPTTGAGMGTACACAAITGAKNEAITFSRSTSAYCTKEGLASSGLTTTSLVSCAVDVPRVESNGTELAVRIEEARTNMALRSQELDNGAWTSTATVTANVATSPANTLTAEQLSDGNGAALQGSTQAVASTTQVVVAASCYVAAGSATSATIALTGTGNSAGNCSATTTSLTSAWSRISCSSSAAYGSGITAKTITVSVGNTVAVTGTVYVWGCQLEDGAFPTSYIATTTAAATRAGDGMNYSGSLAAFGANGSAAITVQPFGSAVQIGGLLVMNSSGRPLYIINSLRTFDASSELTVSAGLTASVAKRYWSSWATGGNLVLTNATDAATTSAAFDGSMNTTGPLGIGTSGVVGTNGNWLISRVCLDPDSTRCR